MSSVIATVNLPQPVQRSRGYWASVWQRFTHDPVAMGAALLVLAMFFVLLNLLVDVLQSLLDPRIARS